MSTERFVVLGLAHVRSAWFREVSRWATSAVIPLDFIKCVSIGELRTRIVSGRAFSAVVADAGLAGIDRDLIELARDIGCAVILVDTSGNGHDRIEIGVSAILSGGFGQHELLSTLREHSALIDSATVASVGSANSEVTPSTPVWRGRVFAVTGVRGTGTSTCAIALAQGLASSALTPGSVLLADLALDADQAMLHHARDIVPGLQELVDAFRHGSLPPEELVAMTYGEDHPYRLLLGLRRHGDWTALRPRAWLAALEGLRRTFTHMVADIDPDIEGESDCGSIDIEERNLLSRSAVDVADVVVVTSTGGLQGTHRLVRVVSCLLEHGVRPERLLLVVNRAPRGTRTRAEITRAVGALLENFAPGRSGSVASPVFLGEQRRLDNTLRDAVGVPSSMAQILSAAVSAVALRAEDLPTAAFDNEPVVIVPGTLGSWAPSQEAAG